MTERLLEMARMKGKSIIIRWAREIAEKKDVSFMSMAKQKKKIVEIIDRLILRAAAGA